MHLRSVSQMTCPYPNNLFNSAALSRPFISCLEFDRDELPPPTGFSECTPTLSFLNQWKRWLPLTLGQPALALGRKRNPFRPLTECLQLVFRSLLLLMARSARFSSTLGSPRPSSTGSDRAIKFPFSAGPCRLGDGSGIRVYPAFGCTPGSRVEGGGGAGTECVLLRVSGGNGGSTVCKLLRDSGGKGAGTDWMLLRETGGKDVGRV